MSGHCDHVYPGCVCAQSDMDDLRSNLSAAQAHIARLEDSLRVALEASAEAEAARERTKEEAHERAAVVVLPTQVERAAGVKPELDDRDFCPRCAAAGADVGQLKLARVP